MYKYKGRGEGDGPKQSDDDFWNENQTGLDFGDSESSSLCGQFPVSMIENNKLIQFDPKYDGQKEISSNKYTYETSVRAITSSEEKNKDNILAIQLNLPTIKPKQHSKDSGTTNCYETIKTMVLGMEYNLKPFKALVEKRNLLNAAIQSHDGNAILVVILFLRSTLKKSIFQKEIMMYPDAVNMYLSYLHEGREIHELADMLLLLRRPGDAAILKYEDANLIHDQKRKHTVLGNLLNTYCQSDTVERFISDSVLEHFMCIEDHKVLMDHRVVSEQNDEEILETVIGRRQISDSCAVHTLIFSILHFYNVAEIANISPTTLRKRYKIPPQKYQWCAFVTLAATRCYQNLDNLFLTKKWLGGMKIQSYIPYQTMLEILSMFEAPLEVIEKYCGAIENQVDKLSLAQKYHCNPLVTEILKKKRNRIALIEFQSTLSPDSTDYQNISAIINSVDIKWKN